MRRLIVVLIGSLLAVQVIRNSAVIALAELYPETATRIWAGHPAVELWLSLAQIGRDSRDRKPIDQSTFALVNDAAQKAVLSPQPFLIRGVQARLAGDRVTALRDFRAAQLRDPRSMAAAYFLAEHYLQAGQPLEGLRQTALVARLSPRGVAAVAPYVALYARDRSNWPHMRALFRSDPPIAEAALEALASDPGNAEAVLALADSRHLDPSAQWINILLQSLVAAGDYSKAKAVWASFAAIPATSGNLLNDPDFSKAEAPAPFNWTLVSSSVGLAERQPGRQLHVIFYGQDDGVLASQLLLLPPGVYRFHMSPRPDAVHAELLGWSIRCDKSSAPIAATGLDGAVRGWTFQVPANCPAQWLELSGRSADVAQQADVAIGPLSLASGERP